MPTNCAHALHIVVSLSHPSVRSAGERNKHPFTPPQSPLSPHPSNYLFSTPDRKNKRLSGAREHFLWLLTSAATLVMRALRRPPGVDNGRRSDRQTTKVITEHQQWVPFRQKQLSPFRVRGGSSFDTKRALINHPC